VFAPHNGVAQIQGALITVVAVDHFPCACAAKVRAANILGAEIVVVALSPRDTLSPFERCVQATHHRVAGIFRAGIPVIAVDRYAQTLVFRAHHLHTRRVATAVTRSIDAFTRVGIAVVTVSAGVLVVAVLPKIDAALVRLACVYGAGIPVIGGDELMLTFAGVRVAGIDRASIPVVAGEHVQTLSGRFVAGIISAKVLVIAITASPRATVIAAFLTIAIRPAVNAVTAVGIAGVDGGGVVVVAAFDLVGVLALPINTGFRGAQVEHEAFTGTGLSTNDGLPGGKVNAVHAVSVVETLPVWWTLKLRAAATFQARPVLAGFKQLALADVVKVIARFTLSELASATYAFLANQALGARERAAPVSSYAWTTWHLKALNVRGVGQLALLFADLAKRRRACAHAIPVIAFVRPVALPTSAATPVVTAFLSFAVRLTTRGLVDRLPTRRSAGAREQPGIIFGIGRMSPGERGTTGGRIGTLDESRWSAGRIVIPNQTRIRVRPALDGHAEVRGFARLLVKVGALSSSRVLRLGDFSFLRDILDNLSNLPRPCRVVHLDLAGTTCDHHQAKERDAGHCDSRHGCLPECSNTIDSKENRRVAQGRSPTVR